MYSSPRPPSLASKRWGNATFCPLCEAERGWGEFMLLIIDI